MITSNIKQQTLNLLYAALCVSVITSCKNKKEDQEISESRKGNPLIIQLTAEQFKTAGLELGSVQEKNLRSVVKANGYLAVPPQNKASVSTFIGAVVKFIHVDEGTFVKQGQVLAILEHPDIIKKQEEYLTEKNNFSFLEKEFLRQKELAVQNAGTGKVFQKAESDYNTSKAKLSSLEGQLKMLSVNMNELLKGNIVSSVVLPAPISGYIGQININIGAYAEPNKKLFEITDNTKIHCDLLIYEKDLFKIKVGQKINFVLANQPEHQQEHNNKTIEGIIFGINKSFESDTKAFVVHANVENENHELIAGMYVNASVDIGGENTMAVPVDAVVKSDGKEWIFIVDGSPGNYTFKMMEVVTGVSDLDFVEINPIEKISPDAKVVIRNPFFILSKTQESVEE